jgi:hypothetical protein
MKTQFTTEPILLLRISQWYTIFLKKAIKIYKDPISGDEEHESRKVS